MEITGTIKWIGELKQAKNGSNIVTFVVEEYGVQYPDSFVCELYGEKFEKNHERLTIGAVLTVGINARAKEWEGRQFNSLSCWKLSVPQQAQQPMYGAQPQYQQAPPQQQYAQPAPQYQQAPHQGYPQGGYQQAPPQPQYQPQQSQMPFPPPTPGGQGAF